MENIGRIAVNANRPAWFSGNDEQRYSLWTEITTDNRRSALQSVLHESRAELAFEQMELYIAMISFVRK